jgi:hypothetical protein
MFPCEPLRSLSHKVHVRTIAQNLSRRPYRVAQPLNTTNAASAQGGAIHDERIQLHFAVAIKKAAAAGVKGLVIFHDDHSFLDSVERRTAPFQHAPTCSHGVEHAIQMGFDHVIGNGPGTAVNYKDRISQEKSSGGKTKVE